MPLRPDLPTALNLSRRPTATPVKLPRMSFPMVGGPAESAGFPGEAQFLPPAAEQEQMEVPQTMMMDTRTMETRTAEPRTMEHRPEAMAMTMTSGASAETKAANPQAQRVIMYGRSGSLACMEAVQDLIDRQISFSYFDVDRDAQAMRHLQAIAGGDPVVPVIIYIGFRAN